MRGAQRAIYFFQVSVMHHFYNPGSRRHLFALVLEWSMTELRMTDDSQILFPFPLHPQNLEEKFREISMDVGRERTLLLVHILTLRVFLRLLPDYDKPRTRHIFFKSGVAGKCWLMLMWDTVIFFRKSVPFFLIISTSTTPHALFLT